MDEITRLRYLEAMGIQVWQLRTLPENPAIATSSTINAIAVEPSSASSEDVSAQWALLAEEVRHCQACGLCQTRTQTVFGVGRQDAEWLLIGEAPGQSEDEQGEPFVGRAGQLLNEMLLAMGLKREQVYIANMLKCRPPGNRDPHVDELAACEHFLLRQIGLIQPKIILAVGRIAAQNLLKQGVALSKLRGQMHQFQRIPLAVVHHPSYLLRAPLEKRKAWEDLQFALTSLRAISAT